MRTLAIAIILILCALSGQATAVRDRISPLTILEQRVADLEKRVTGRQCIQMSADMKKGLDLLQHQHQEAKFLWRQAGYTSLLEPEIFPVG